MRPGRLLLVAAVITAFAAPVDTQAPTIEYDVKATFLLNFSRFIDWPANRRAQPFRLCTVEPDPFGTRLEAAAAGETWERRQIEIVRLTTARHADCHLLYVPLAAMADFRAAQGTLTTPGTLLVGEAPDFLFTGGMIRLFLESNRVRFSVNQRACEAAGLRVSSRLLRLAREVVPREDSQ